MNKHLDEAERCRNRAIKLLARANWATEMAKRLQKQLDNKEAESAPTEH